LNKDSTYAIQRTLFILVSSFFFICLGTSAQRGVVSGVLEDESGPLPGTTVIVKGTTNGTETDFDGNYSIECQVGDILQFTFIGMVTREIKVTRDLFGDQILKSIIREESVQKIISNDYYEALKTVIDSLAFTPEISENGLTYNKKKGYFDSNRIKNIKESQDKIKVTYFSPDILYQVNSNSNISLQFVDKNKLPKLQNTFAQGRPFNGINQWFGAETNEIFSFGPRVNTLTFDGSNYIYDTNGRLINGTSQNQILPYNNEIFQSGSVLSNNLNLAVSNNIHSVDVNVRKKTQEDLFDFERNSLTQFDFNYDFKNKISAFFKSNTETNNQPNINGFLNNLILSSFITPTSFENSQGYLLSNNMQRSFSPNQFNNPLWLFELNQNRSKSTSTIIGAKSNIQLNDNLKLNSILSFNREKDQLNFALPINTIGFEDGYRSKKNFTENTFHAYVGLDYHFNIEDFSQIEIKSSLKYKNLTLNYNLLEQNDFSDLNFINPTNETTIRRQLENNTFRMANEIMFDLDVEFDADITLINNSVTSTFQGNELLLPSAQLYVEFQELLGYPEWMDTFSIATGIAKEAKETPLFYSNLSHNSLVISPQESQSLVANNDLFNSKALAFETATNFDIETNLRLFNNVVNIGINYYHSKTNNGIFPVLTNGIFELQNIASIKNEGLEASLEFNIGRDWDNFHYQPTFLFSKSRGKVLELSGNKISIPIAGFSTISNNLIVGQQTGTIVGSAYLRDNNGSIVIDNDGYPIVDSEKKIIGNTTPDFNLSMDNNFNIGKFRFNFLIDYQKGGDVWNGTKNVLNYTGRSQESANLRGITNFVFDGVNQLGNTNTTAVDFASSNQDVSLNRWVRYGFNGVDEEAIVEGTFINLKSISISYDFANRNEDEFFRKLELSFYAYNLLSYTKENGISPYSSLFDHSSGKGLDYFNMPLVKEIGFKINIKI